MKRRILYVVLAMFIVFSNLPMTALAAEQVNETLTVIEVTATAPVYAGMEDDLYYTCPTVKFLHIIDEEKSEELTFTWEEIENNILGAYGYHYDIELEDSFSWPLSVGTAKAEFHLMKTNDGICVSETTFDIEVIPNPVKEIKATANESLVENFEGVYGEWCEKCDDGEVIGEYFCYWFEESNITVDVTYTDGTTESYNWRDISDETGYELLLKIDQSETPLKVGSNTVKVSYMGHEADLIINVVEHPIASISVNPGTINELDYYMAGDLDDEGQYVQYKAYDLDYETATITINFTDTTKSPVTLTLEEAVETFGYPLDTYIDQGYYNQLVPGDTTYSGVVSFMGKKCDFTFKIVPNPVKSISARATKSLIQNRDGSDYGYYFYYDVYKTEPEVTVEYIDGTKATYSYVQMMNMKYDIYVSARQSSETPLQAGENTGYITFAEKRCEYKFTIVEDNIESIVVTPTKDLIENVDGDYYYSDEDESDKYFNYHVSLVEPTLTITYKDGSKEIYDYLSLCRYSDFDFDILDDNQDEAPFALGENTTKMRVLGRDVEFKFNIVSQSASQKVKTVEVIPETCLIENDGGYWEWYYTEDGEEVDFYWYYLRNLTYTVKFTYEDGSTNTYTGVSAGDIIEGSYLYIDTNTYYPKNLNVGTNKVEFSYRDIAGEFELEVIANPYKKLEISGENELILTLTKENGSTESYKAVGADYGTIYTDSGRVFKVGFECDYNKELKCYENWTITMFYHDIELKSNTLKTNNWIPMNDAMTGVIYPVALYADGYSERLYDRIFKGLNSGTITGSAVDDALTISSWGRDDYDFLSDEKGLYVVLSLDSAESWVGRYFDSERFDFTSSPMYDEKTGLIKVYVLYRVEGGVSNGKLEYKNGLFVYTADFVSNYTTTSFTIIARYVNGVYFVDSISIHEEEADHVYDAGVITKESTCNVHGTKLFTCECGATRTEEVEFAPHTDAFVGTKEVHTKCAVCGATTSAEHDFTSKVIKEATATTKGVEELTCECGYTCQIETEIHELGEVKIEAAKTNEFSATVSDVDVKAKLELTANEKYLLSQGLDLKLIFKLDDLGVNVDTTEKKAIADALGGKKLGAFLDIQLVKQIGNYEGNVTKLGGEIKVSLELPAELINTDKSLERIYKILRYHEGDENKVTVLDAVFDEATKTITFATDRFSTYAVVYEDVSAKDEVPDAGVISTSVIWFGAMAASGLGAITLSKKKKED